MSFLQLVRFAHMEKKKKVCQLFGWVHLVSELELLEAARKMQKLCLQMCSRSHPSFRRFARFQVNNFSQERWNQAMEQKSGSLQTFCNSLTLSIVIIVQFDFYAPNKTRNKIYPNPGGGAGQTMPCLLVFQRTRTNHRLMLAAAPRSVCASRPLKSASPKSSPARVPCVPPPPSSAPTKDHGFKMWMEKKKKEKEGEKGVGENKKEEKNVGYARLIFRASEECAEAPLVSPFSFDVPMKRDRGGGGGFFFFLSSPLFLFLFFFGDHLVKAEPLLIFSGSGVPVHCTCHIHRLL